MKIGEAIQKVLSKYNKGVQSKDSRLSPRHVYSELLSARGVVIKNQYNQNSFISEWSYTPINCIELKKVEKSSCPCVVAGCTTLRSKNKLPRFISGIDDNIISSVYSIDNSTEFDKTTLKAVKYSKGNKYTSFKEKYYIHDNFLWIVSSRPLRAVSLVGVVYDPIEAHLFQGLCDKTEDKDCIDIMDLDFPIDADHEEYVFKIVDQNLLNIFVQMKEDTHNNAVDDSGIQGTMLHRGDN